MNKHKSNKIKENSNTVRHLIMGQIITTQNLVAIKEVRHAGQWCHQMETFSTLLTICASNSPVTGEFPAQRPVTRSFDVFFDLRLNGWVNNRKAGDLKCHRTHYDVTVMKWSRYNENQLLFFTLCHCNGNDNNSQFHFSLLHWFNINTDSIFAIYVQCPKCLRYWINVTTNSILYQRIITYDTYNIS